MGSIVKPSLDDMLLLGRATADLYRVHFALRRVGFQHVMSEIEDNETPRRAYIEATDIRRAQRYGRRIATAAHYSLPPAQCLHRSLVLHKWLHNEGFPCELRIGVRKDGAALKAHAWVEMAGVILNDSPGSLGQFTPLVSHASPDGRLKWSSWTDLGRIQWQ